MLNTSKLNAIALFWYTWRYNDPGTTDQGLRVVELSWILLRSIINRVVTRL